MKGATYEGSGLSVYEAVISGELTG